MALSRVCLVELCCSLRSFTLYLFAQHPAAFVPLRNAISTAISMRTSVTAKYVLNCRIAQAFKQLICLLQKNHSRCPRDARERLLTRLFVPLT